MKMLFFPNISSLEASDDTVESGLLDQVLKRELSARGTGLPDVTIRT